jgi:acyl carrier protein
VDVRERVIAIIAEQALLDPADLRDEMTLKDLGLESLGLVESIFMIEEAFDVSIPFNANDPTAGGFDASSVGSIVASVERLVAERG